MMMMMMMMMMMVVWVVMMMMMMMMMVTMVMVMVMMMMMMMMIMMRMMMMRMVMMMMMLRTVMMMITTRREMVWSGDADFVEAVKTLKLSAETAAQVRCIHLTWQQIELSACIIGANPNALAKAFREGALKEADLAAVGFHGDAEFEFLQQCSAAYEGADKILRGMMTLELHRIYRARHLSPQQRSTQQHPAPGGDDAAKRQAAEQREKSMQAVLTAIKAVPLAQPASH